LIKAQLWEDLTYTVYYCIRNDHN